MKNLYSPSSSQELEIRWGHFHPNGKIIAESQDNNGIGTPLAETLNPFIVSAVVSHSLYLLSKNQTD